MKKYLHPKNIKNIILALPSFLLFSISMPLDSYCSDGVCGPSWLILLVGWMGIMASIVNILWLCNVFIFLSWINILKNNKKKSVIYSSLSSLSVLFIYFNNHVYDESGVIRDITSIEIGYYLWLASALAALIASFFVPKNPVSIVETVST